MKNFSSVDEYINSFPANVQPLLKELRNTVKKAAPKTQEKISYGIPGYKIYGRRLIYFGGFRDHVSLFPAGSSAIEAFQKELKEYETSKGTIRFPLDKPLPTGLIEKIIKFRVNENLAKK